MKEHTTFTQCIAWVAFYASMIILVFGILTPLSTWHYRTREQNMIEIFDGGYSAGKLNQPPEACPYNGVWDEEKRQQWMNGWLRGDAERRTQK